MVAITGKWYRVADLMDQFGVGLDEMESFTGIDVDVLKAIARQRYTPSPHQRDRVSSLFGVSREQIIWGHATEVQEYIHAPI